MKILLTIILVFIIGSVSIVGGIYAYLSPEDGPPKILSPSSVRAIHSGQIIGMQGNNGVHAWFGIPYAKPPVGELRWKAPRPVDPWQERKELLSKGNVCTQMPLNPGDVPGPIGSEDCLTLNIWAPPYAEERVPSGDSALPVMFWIHGGGNSMGEGGSSIYDGSLLAVEHNVILVTINYRLGPLGWFVHPGLRGLKANAEDGSGNYGTLDIIAALNWVQTNIAVFGGDPGNVTIFGESAGGFDVLTMMVSPLAEGLFHRAISQSGGLNITSVSTGENYHDDDVPGDSFSSREVINQLLIIEGRADSRDKAKSIQDAMDANEISEWLRSKTPEEIYAIYGSGFGGMISNPDIFGDGHVLPDDMQAEQIFSDTRFYNEVPVILGTNRDETKLFMMMDNERVDKIAGLPSGIRDLAGYNRDAMYGSNLWKARAVDDLATLMRNSQGDSVYTYRFDADDWRNLGIIDLKDLLGAAHALEIPFVFGNFPNPLRVIFPGSTFDDIQLLSNSMMSYWVEFAYEGAPGRGRDGNELLWTAWQNEPDQSPRIIILDTELDGGIRMSSERITLQEVKQTFLGDTTYGSQASYCNAYERFFRDKHFVETEYRNLGESGCNPPD